MTMPVFISHYTKDTPYEEVVLNLIQSLKKHRLQYCIEGINSLGSWRANSNYCAKQVQKMLIKYHPKPILRLDADAVVQRMPTIFLQEWYEPDVAAVIWMRSKMVPPPLGELLGGTLYFANNDRSTWIVDKWVRLCEKEPHKRNSDLLRTILDRYKNKVKFKRLPLTYCTIFDSMAKQVTRPVIEHFQASREYKSIVNRMGREDVNAIRQKVS